MNITPCIVGLGYVGLPALIRLSKKFDAHGVDINKSRIETLSKRIDTNCEFSKKKLSIINIKNLTTNFKKINRCNFFIVCVPTPINSKKKPNLKPLIDACENIGKILKKNDIIVFESTVYTGITEEVCIPVLEKRSKLNYKDEEFFVCYSPERINPGDKKHTIDKINKLIAIPNKKCEELVKKIYKSLGKKIFISSSIKETETSKVIENIQRDLNIALMNEVFIFCNKSNLNFYNVLKQARTKWNFGNYLPGLVGGHCLPVDPYYFSHIARKKKFNTRITLAGRSTNEYMRKFVIQLIKKNLKENNIDFKKQKIIFAGLTYKKNVSDLRNSHSLKIFQYFRKISHNAYGLDPFLSKNNFEGLIDISDINYKSKIACIILLVNHDEFKNMIRKIDKKIHIINIFNFFNNKK